jgi:MFS superfamily sulfate permease-like transporter
VIFFLQEYIEIFSNIVHTNIATLLISIVSIIFLYVIKHFINEKFKAKLPVPVPVELLLVIGATITSHFGKLDTKYHVKTVGYLPLGLVAFFSDFFKDMKFYAI